MKSIVEFVKSTVVGGLVFLVPVIVLVYVFGKALIVAKRLAEPVSTHLPVGTVVGVAIVDLIGLALIMVVCFVAGLMARSSLARSVVNEAEDRFLWKIPVYGMVKGVTESIGDEGSSSLTPVLAKLDDAAQVAFEIERLSDGRVVVFMPSSPDAWSGSVLIMTEDRIEPLQASLVAAVQNMRARGRGTQQLLAPPA
jgi:uncharacterized membrane protein